MKYEDLTRKIIGAAMEVHKALGNAAAGTTIAREIEQGKQELVTNCDRFEKLKYSSFAPYAFTEEGVAILPAVMQFKWKPHLIKMGFVWN